MRHDTPARVAVAFTQRVNAALVQQLQHLRVNTATVAHARANPTCTRKEREMSEAKRSKVVAFRLTDEEYGEIERAAAAAGDEPNNWCRQLALTAAREGPLFGKTGRLIYTELAVLRF
jgi:hypothetical protein